MNARPNNLNLKSFALKSALCAALAAFCLAAAAPAGYEYEHGDRTARQPDRELLAFETDTFGSTEIENRPAEDLTGTANPGDPAHEEPVLFGQIIRIGAYERHAYSVEVPAGISLIALETLGETPLGIAIYDVKGSLLTAEPTEGGIACGLMVEAKQAMTIVIEITNPTKWSNGYVLWMNG